MGSAMTPPGPQHRVGPLADQGLSPAWLVRTLGTHPAHALGLQRPSEADDAELERWLLASCQGSRASF